MVDITTVYDSSMEAFLAMIDSIQKGSISILDGVKELKILLI